MDARASGFNDDEIAEHITERRAILFASLGLQGNPMLIFITLFVWTC